MVFILMCNITFCLEVYYNLLQIWRFITICAYLQKQLYRAATNNDDIHICGVYAF